MKSLSDKIFKNYQVNIGLPFMVKIPVEAPAPEDGERRDAGDLSNGAESRFIVRELDENFGADDAAVDQEVKEEAAEMPDPLEAAAAEAERIMNEARELGEQLIKAVKDEAAEIISAAEREADDYYTKTNEQAASESAALREQAKREGALEGKKEGRDAYDTLIFEAEQIRGEAIAEYRRLINGAESDALELVLRIAKKVIGDEIAYNRGSLISMIRDAFRHCTNKDDVVMKVSTEDYDYVLENRDALLSTIEGVDNFEIRRDLSLSPGACFIETPFGSLDAGADTRFFKIEEAFYRILSVQRPATDDLSA
jgi:flagellar assembly protein FliH